MAAGMWAGAASLLPRQEADGYQTTTYALPKHAKCNKLTFVRKQLPFVREQLPWARCPPAVSNIGGCSSQASSACTYAASVHNQHA